MEENKNEKNYKKEKIIHYKNLSSDDFCEPFYYSENKYNEEKKLMRFGTLSNKSFNKKDLPKKKRLFNFVEMENKNKNLKVYDGKKFKPYLIGNNNNIICNYYDNRKFSSIIFNRLHGSSLQNNNCKKSIVNKLYFCTKINIKKRKKKSKKSKKDLLKTEKETEMNNIKNYYKNRLSSNSIDIQGIKQEQYYTKEIKNSTTNDFKNKNNFKSKNSFQNISNNNSKNKNQKSNLNYKHSKTLYPKYSTGNITEFKLGKETSSNNPNSSQRKKKHNYTFYELAIRKNIYNPNKIRLDKYELNKKEKKENIKIPIINVNIGDKFIDLLLPKIKYNVSNMNNKYRVKNIKSNSFLNSIDSINQKNNTFYYTNRNNHKHRTIKNKNQFGIKNQKKINKNFSSSNIMNFNYKDFEKLNNNKNNNTIGIHYLNDSLCSICHPYFNNYIDKLNTTQMTKSSSVIKNNSPFNSYINRYKNKDQSRKNNTKKNLKNRKEFNRIIHKRFFDSLQKNNKNNNLKKENKQNIDEIILRKYEKKFVSINEYFN